ncbi:MAG TPA: hypothetical protein VJU86_06205 [Pyrinomonadaceae bacterium]|nr:hypothetical protein [Pyrinomonadaceae bacterium]
MKAMFLLIVLSCFCSVYGQTTDERIKHVFSNLACKESQQAIGYDFFVEALRRGERGDGVRYPWMDKMHKLGIKQAYLVVHFSYKNGAYSYKVEKIDYLRRYYCREDEVQAGELLKQIRRSGLEQELKDAIIAKLKKYERPYQAGNVTEGESHHYLLDDEHLPGVDFVTSEVS